MLLLGYSQPAQVRICGALIKLHRGHDGCHLHQALRQLMSLTAALLSALNL